MDLGEKMKKMGKGQKKSTREETPQNFPSSGCKIDFSLRGGGNNMIHLHNIYAYNLILNLLIDK